MTSTVQSGCHQLIIGSGHPGRIGPNTLCSDLSKVQESKAPSLHAYSILTSRKREGGVEEGEREGEGGRRGRKSIHTKSF